VGDAGRDSSRKIVVNINKSDYSRFADGWRIFCISGTGSDYIKTYLKIRGKFLGTTTGPKRLQASFLPKPGVETRRKRY
jgi:hypothetical protein